VIVRFTDEGNAHDEIRPVTQKVFTGQMRGPPLVKGGGKKLKVGGKRRGEEYKEGVWGREVVGGRPPRVVNDMSVLSREVS